MKHARPKRMARGMVSQQRAAKPAATGSAASMEVEVVIQGIHQRAAHVGSLLNDILQIGHGEHPEKPV